MKPIINSKMKLLILLGSLLIVSVIGMALIPNSRAKAAITPADYPNVIFDTLFNTGSYAADDIAFYNGNIYTIDNGPGISGRVRKYNQSGNMLLNFDIPESSSLNGICADSECLYISDQGKNMIYKYDTSGNKIGEVATEAGPSGITVKGDYLYVVCQSVKKVQKISTSLSVAQTYDVSADLSGPKSITTDGTYIYVGNFYNDGKIVKYDANFNNMGEYIGNTGTSSYSQAQDLFYYDNHIYVSTGYYIISITVDTMEQAYDWTPDMPISACVMEDGNFLATTGSSIKISRLVKSNSNLSSLTVSGGYSLSPAFSSDQTSYSVEVPSTVTSLDIIPTLADTSATMTVLGNAVASGNPISYNVGPEDNPIKINVTAEDGVSKSTYTVVIRVKVAPDCRYIRYQDAGSQYPYEGVMCYDTVLYIGEAGQCAFLFDLSDVTGTVVEASINIKTQNNGAFLGGRDFVYDLYSAEDNWVGGVSFPEERNPVLLGVGDDRIPDYNIAFNITDFVDTTLATADKKTTLIFDTPDEDFIGVYDNSATAMDRPYLFIRVQAIDTLSADYDYQAPQDINFNIVVDDTLSSIVNGAYTLIEDTDYVVSGKAVTIKKEYLATLSIGSYDFTVNLAQSMSQTLTIDVEENTYTINAIADVILNEVNKGYTVGSQETKTITIQKTGTMDLVNLSTSISGGINSKFILTQPANTTLNPSSSSTTFTVKAKDGLAPGTYTETITIKADNMKDVTFQVTQVVNAPPEAFSLSISGTPTLGNAVSGSYSFYDVDGDKKDDPALQWYRSSDSSGADKEAIAGATSFVYTIQLADIGKYIGFEVTPKALTGSLTGTSVIKYVGPIPPLHARTLTADTTDNDVNHTIDITYSVDKSFTAAITGVSFNGHTLTPSQYTVDTTNNNKITLNPGADTGNDLQNSYLQTAGTGDIVVSATGYSNSVVQQTITAGTAASLAITTQPVVDTLSGDAFTTQPVITLKDIYGNLCSTGPSATAKVTAAVTTGTSGSWNITGTTQVNAVNGVATFTNLSCNIITPGSSSITFSIGSINISSDSFALTLKSSITLTADTDNNNVDHDIIITFPVNADFEAKISSVSYNGTVLTNETDYSISSGKVTLKPVAGNSVLITPATNKELVIKATGYQDSKVTQTIEAGALASIMLTTQPITGLLDGAAFTSQPVVALYDQYNNLCSSGPSANIKVIATAATTTSGTCMITGTTEVSAVAGVATFTDLKCSQVTPGLGAITFSSGSVTVNSNTFSIPLKAEVALTPDTTDNNVDNDIEITFTPNLDFEGKITSITYNGVLLSLTTDYIIESGKITLKPQGGNPALTTASPLNNIVITATGYLDSYINQAIGHGALASLTLTENITAPASNGGLFAVQPVITLKDQYGNICTGDNSTTVTVSKKDSGTWTLSGTVTAIAVNGVVTFLDLGTTNSAHVAGAQLAFNTTGIPEVLSAEVNLPAPASPPPSPVTPSSPSSTPAPVATEQITGEIIQGTSNDTIAKIMIERATYADGSKTDSVTFHESKVAEVIEELKKSGESTVRIVIPDTKDEVSQTTFRLPTDTIDTLAKGNIGLQIATEEAKIDIPQKAIQVVNDNSKEDLYFNLVPVTEEKQQKEIIERSRFKAALVSGSSDSSIAVVGVPVTIETNMPSTDVYITLPLSGVTIPTNEAEREAFINQLAVYIEHSDGTKELIKGELVTYSDGVMGIKFHITKFSIFTIVRTNALANQSVSASCDVTKVTVPKKTTLDGTKITSTVANKISSVTIKLKVSDKASWELYSDKACTKLLSNHTMKLKTGANKAYIKVTAENGTTKIYTITITRQKSSAAAVTKVTAPAKAVIKDTVITATVKSSTDKLTFKVSVSNKATWVLYSDKACKKKIDKSQINLKTGLNTYYLKVTAEDGKTSKVYTVKITRR